MPPLPSTPAIKIVAGFQMPGGGKDIINIFHAAYTGAGPSAGTLLTYGAAIDTAIDNFTTTFMHTSTAHAFTDYTDLGSSSGAAVRTTPGTAGGNSGTIAPANVSAVVSWKISRRYRGGHPRTYVGGLSDSQLSDPYFLNPTFQGNLQTAGNNFIAAVAGAASIIPGSTLVCVSYFSGNSLRVTPVQEVITDASVAANIRTQRRRIEGT